MRSILLIGLLLCASAFCVLSQTPSQHTALTQPRALSIRAFAAENRGSSIPPANLKTAATPTPQPTNDYVRPDPKTRFKRYAKSMFAPEALGKDVLTAGWLTWRNSPEEWGPHWEGFGKRFASTLGIGIINKSITYGLDESFKLDSHYYRSKDKSVGARLRNALISPFTARNRNGRRVFGFPRITGTYTANIIATETWYPNRYSYKDGLRNGTISFGLNIASNLFQEFVWRK